MASPRLVQDGGHDDHLFLPALKLVNGVRLNLQDEVVDSEIFSIFDLLYSRYSQRLEHLATRIVGKTRYQSENITWTVLLGILSEERYTHLTASSQVLLRNLLPVTSKLTARQQDYVKHRASIDFVVYNRVTNYPLLAIEVNGFAFHENNPAQRERDNLKKQILEAHGLHLLTLPTTGSGEEERIRQALEDGT